MTPLVSKQYALFEKQTGRRLAAGPWHSRRNAWVFRDWFRAHVKDVDLIARRVDGAKKGEGSAQP